MRYSFFSLVFVLMGLVSVAQEQPVVIDTSRYAVVTVQKDARIDIFGEKMAAYNSGLSKNIRSGKGYRLMLLSTNDRNMAMQLRSRLLQRFPQHKIYMIYQNPFIKLKMGNFVEKADAEAFRKELLRLKMVPGNVYLLPEMVEIRPGDMEAEEE